MKKYISLLYLTIVSFAYPMQEADNLKPVPYTITTVNSPLSNPDIFNIIRYHASNDKTEKRALIINEKDYSYIDATCVYDNYSVPTPDPTRLCDVGSNLHKYNLAVCIINPHSYNPISKTFDKPTEKAINLLASGTLKTHYLLSSPNKETASLLKKKIESLYKEVETEKKAQIIRAELSNTLKNASLKGNFSRLRAIFSKIFSLPILFLILKMTDHPEFPWPAWQPAILNGIPLLMALISIIN